MFYYREYDMHREKLREIERVIEMEVETAFSFDMYLTKSSVSIK